MRNKAFNPKEWLKQSGQKQEKNKTTKSGKVKKSKTQVRQIWPNESSNNNHEDIYKQVENIVHEIESTGIDITAEYKDWVNLGFAFADEFGETGRGFFHRASQYYSSYNFAECDKQYDYCLKSNGQGIRINTFFYLAKKAGISITSNNVKCKFETETQNVPLSKPEHELNTDEDLPTFTESVYANLPKLLNNVIKAGTSDEEKDILLLGSLTTISACLPNIYGIYGGKKVFPHLFTFITAKASAGKGILIFCRKLVKPIHDKIRERVKEEKQNYELELAEYNSKKSKDESLIKPKKPKEQMLFIPANNSSTGVYQILDDSDGRGLIFETEGDTLAQAFKSDYGNYSDGFRKAAQHEPITYYRRTDQEYVEIDEPCLATLLSGTPNQIITLIPSAENGLFSRFLFYFMKMKIEWKNVFENNTENCLEEHFDELGQEILDLHDTLEKSQDILFKLTSEQQKEFNRFFSKAQIRQSNLKGEDYIATVRRLGISIFRICMSLSVLRLAENGDDMLGMIVCEQQDFNTALAMAKVLLEHSGKVFNELPQEKTKPKRLNRKEKFLNVLPKHFNRQNYLDVASDLKLPAKTAEGYITSFVKDGLIHREKQDTYINISIEENEESEEVKDS